MEPGYKLIKDALGFYSQVPIEDDEETTEDTQKENVLPAKNVVQLKEEDQQKPPLKKLPVKK